MEQLLISFGGEIVPIAGAHRSHLGWHSEVLLLGGLCISVVWAYLLAGVAAIDTMSQVGGYVMGQWPSMLDGQIGEATAAINAIGG